MKSKKNKKKFLKSVKKLIIGRMTEKGVIAIDEKAMAALIMLGYIKVVPGTSGTWYQMLIGEMQTEYSLMQVKPGMFKVVLSSDIRSLDRYHWYYNGKNVYTFISVGSNVIRDDDSGMIVYLERVILDLHKYGQGIIKDTGYDAHHMWFRWCAVADMLKSLDKQTHWAGHKATGNYSRSQCIRIANEEDYIYFVSQLIWAHNFLSTKQFGMEF